MAKLLYSLADLDNNVRRKFKKVFETLDDGYQIRTPILAEAAVAQIVIEGPCKSWLLIGYHVTNPSVEELTKYLKLNNDLFRLNFNTLKYLAITDTGETMFDPKDASLSHVVIIEKQAFFDQAEKLIKANLVESSEEQFEWIMKMLFSETHIHAACTTRRAPVRRDNSAKFQTFFLNFDQEQATKLDLLENLPLAAQMTVESDIDHWMSVRLINGVAGSGKTLILINRAILYCKKYPDKQALFIIHNKPIVEIVRYNFTTYYGGVPKNLKICTFHSFALSQQSVVIGNTKPLFSGDLFSSLKKQILSNELEPYQKLQISDLQIWSEIEYINDYLIEDKSAYLEYDRQGRGFALQRSQREMIWHLYELSVKLLASADKGYLPSLYIRQLAISEGVRDKLRQYDHILIDEAQFFFPSWFQLAKLSLVDNGLLFICADPNQGFLKSRLSWKNAGLNVRGRTKKLNYSYRTTCEILSAANALLESIDEDSDDFVKPDLNNMVRGSKPRVIYSNTTQDEENRFLNELKCCVTLSADSSKNNMLLDPASLNQIMVLFSKDTNAKRLKNIIENAIGKNTVVNCNDFKDLTSNLGGRIRLASINSCTGMESGVAFVVGIGPLLNEENNLDLKEDEREIVRHESLRRLYVAMTRAGQKLILLSTQKLPNKVEALVDIDGALLPPC